MTNEWFKKAQSDLQAAELLRKAKNYNNAVFHLQQADEKIAKGILYDLGLMSENKDIVVESTIFYRALFKDSKFQLPTAIDYSHDWHVTLANLLKRMVEVVKNSNYLPINSDNFKVLEELNKEYKEINEQELRKKIFEAKAISNMQGLVKTNDLTGAVKIDLSMKSEKKDIKIPSQNIDLSKLIPGAIEESTKVKPNITITQKQVLNGLSGDLLIKFFYLVALALIIEILYPHEQLSRYPSKEIYDENNLLVINFSEIEDILTTILNKFI